MMLLVNNDVVIGEVTGVEVFGHERYVIITSNSSDVYSELLDLGNYLFFFISGDNCIQIIKRGLCEWITEGKSLRVDCSVIDSHYITEGSYFSNIWRSYLRDKSLDVLLDK
jgi:hypothetical protein